MTTVPTVGAPETIRRVAESMFNLSYSTWNFGDSVAFEALIRATEVLSDERYAAFAHGWCRSWATRSTPFQRLDCTAPGWAMVHLAERYDDGRLLAAAHALAAYLHERPTIDGVYATWVHSPLMHPYGSASLAPRHARLLTSPPAGVFIDCLHFDPPFLTALGILTEDDGIVADGIGQALGYVRMLQTAGGLFDHFVLDGIPERFGPGWGRGQGWAILGLMDVIEALDASAEYGPRFASERSLLAASATALIDAMITWQRPDGHWDAVVDDPTSGIEGSTAPFMAHGFTRAVAAGIGTDVDRIRASIAAARTATEAFIEPDGRLREVSAAVMACTEPSHYAAVPRGFNVPWGQGPALLALADPI